MKVKWFLLVALLFGAVTLCLVSSNSYLENKAKQEKVAHINNLLDEMRNGKLGLAYGFVRYSHKHSSDNINWNIEPVEVSLGFSNNPLGDSVALALMEAEARYYFNELKSVNEKPEHSWSSLAPYIRRAYFYAMLTSGECEKTGLSEEELQAMLDKGSQEIREKSDPENGRISMGVIIIEKPLYRVVTPLGPVVPPGGLQSMTKSVVEMVKELAKAKQA